MKLCHETENLLVNIRRYSRYSLFLSFRKRERQREPIIVFYSVWVSASSHNPGRVRTVPRGVAEASANVNTHCAITQAKHYVLGSLRDSQAMLQRPWWCQHSQRSLAFSSPLCPSVCASHSYENVSFRYHLKLVPLVWNLAWMILRSRSNEYCVGLQYTYRHHHSPLFIPVFLTLATFCS